ncbi:hypothetical protein, partial [Lactobacillus nasalidis]|uniref:hypothetical protein n=1 Tax=Lactobacillus nasalidis TaxID=2797258 RepID=UPI0019161042
MTNFDDYAQDDFFQELEIDQSKILDYSISEKIAALDPAGQKDFWWQFYQQARQMHRFFVASSELRANFDVDAVYNRRNADEVYLARPAGSQLSGPCLLLQGVIDSFGFDKNDRPESCQSLFVPENEAAFS